MSLEGFTRARVAGWRRAIAALGADQVICCGCGHRWTRAQLMDGHTPCCRGAYLANETATEMTTAQAGR